MSDLCKLDGRVIPDNKAEIRAFACIKDEFLRLPFLLEYHRKIGIDRFLFIDNSSTDGSIEYLLEQSDCHIFIADGNFFAENVEPPTWSNAIRNVFGTGHWCLSLDADEMFIYPNVEFAELRSLCDFLEKNNNSAFQALVLDMYGDTSIANAQYEQGKNFLDYFPYFDAELGYQVDANGCVPPVLMFSKFRERAFWLGKHKKTRPPCITQVPLVKWNRGMMYLVAQHSLNSGVLSELSGVILHFKFMPGFFDSVIQSLESSVNVKEKGLEERKAYITKLEADPDFSLLNSDSVRYEGSQQLVELAWMKTSPEWDQIACRQANIENLSDLSSDECSAG